MERERLRNCTTSNCSSPAVPLACTGGSMRGYPGFKIFKDQHGKDRCYHRLTRTPIDLRKYPLGSAAFIAECRRISSGASFRDESGNTLRIADNEDSQS